MTAHELAKALLAGPDLPCVVNGWGSEDGETFEIERMMLIEDEEYTQTGKKLVRGDYLCLRD
jgi:hypothetical protein